MTVLSTLRSRGFDLAKVERTSTGDVHARSLKRQIVDFLGLKRPWESYSANVFERINDCAVFDGHPLEGRAAFVIGACAGIEDLRHGVCAWLGYSVEDLFPHKSKIAKEASERRAASISALIEKQSSNSPNSSAALPPDDTSFRPEALERLKASSAEFGNYDQVSRASGVPVGTIQKMMRGATEPKFSTVIAITNVTGASLDWIANGGLSIASQQPVDRPIANFDAVLSSAESFRLAVMALPVGKDIRARLNTALEAHIALIGGAQ